MSWTNSSNQQFALCAATPYVTLYRHGIDSFYFYTYFTTIVLGTYHDGDM